MEPEPHPSSQPGQSVVNVANKLPEIAILFWIIKLLTTGLGETASDFLVHRMEPLFAVVLTGCALVIALITQFSVRLYIPWVYWLAITMVAIFGTMAADAIHVKLGMSYFLSTIEFSVVLGMIFAAWYATEKTLSIDHIYTVRREVFYWITVMATFALGTAAGDMAASSFGLGYFTSGLLFGLLFALPALAYWRSGLNQVVAFWLAYIMTRPLGASFADWLASSTTHGGLGFGTGKSSLVLGLIIIGLVVYVTVFTKNSKGVDATNPN